MPAAFSFFLSWWGALLLGALDTSMLVFVPFGIDALVIFLSARRHELFWLYPLLATAGSTAGAAVTFWLGKKAGEHGLERFVSGSRLKRMRDKVHTGGAIAMAVPALFPPPFPLSPFILTCGALEVESTRFFTAFSAMRLLRFGGEAVLALVYGRGILRILQSDTFQHVIAAFIVVALLGTALSAMLFWRQTRRPLRPA